jgi:hypothetical protein
MNKLIICCLLFISFSLYGQETSGLESPDDMVDINSLTESQETIEEKAEEAPVAEVQKILEEQPVLESKPNVAEIKQTQNNTFPSMVTETVVEEEKDFVQRKSHWISTFAFEHATYELFPSDYEFSGKKNFDKETNQLWGGRLGVGGEIYLGAGFITRSLIEGYYIGSLFSQVLNGGDQDEDIKFAYTKKTGQILGADVSQSLGWMFDLKTKNPFLDQMVFLNVEIFVEAGLGKGWAYNRLNYSYDLGTTDEAIKLRTRDDFTNARTGAGISFTSNQGFFLTLKATANRYDITKRKIDGYIQEDNQAETTVNESLDDAKVDTVMIYTLGGGYKF